MRSPHPRKTHDPSQLLAPGQGCLAAPGVWVLQLAGQPVRCVTPRTPATGSAPCPLPTAAAVDTALRRMKGRPVAVVLGADVDPLLAGRAWEEAAFAAAAKLLEHGVGIRLCTRGAVRGPWAELLRRAARQGGAWLEIGLFSPDPELSRLYEPGAPTPADRLTAARALHDDGVVVEGRLYPMLPWISDTADRIEAVLDAFRRAGARRVRASYLHVDGQGTRQLGGLPPAHRALLQGCLKGEPHRPGEARLLPHGLRAEGHRRLFRIARGRGVLATACAESNPDLRDTLSCFRAVEVRPSAPPPLPEPRATPASRSSSEPPRRQLSLFG